MNDSQTLKEMMQKRMEEVQLKEVNKIRAVVNGGIEIVEWNTIMVHPVNGVCTCTVSTKPILNEIYPDLTGTISFPCEDLSIVIRQDGYSKYHTYSIDKDGRIYSPILYVGGDVPTDIDSDRPIYVISKGKTVVDKDELPDNFWEILTERMRKE